MNETFQERQKRGLRPAQVTITDAQEFTALHMGRKVTTQNGVEGEGEGMTGSNGLPGGIVTHTRAATVTMYKPDGRGHYTPRHSIPVTAIQQNLLNGWFAHCPECNGDHGSDPNDCPARERTAVRVCPVCGKRIYDSRAYQVHRGATDDPNIIHDEHEMESTPEGRTLVARNLHMWVRHPQEARELNLPALANPPDVVADSVGN